ncbi:MAG TPA: Holliday junction resolvase RuvX [Chitinophagales bacterium]|nr:Holliday junction resolvase RuvX [Chitinophagales bacterium]
MGRILAFDYGLKRVGVAVTDPLQIIANTLETLPNASVFDFVKKYCSAEDVEAFVVGYPYSHGTNQNEIIKHIDGFIAKLEQLYPGKKVHKVDESFTSKIASQTLIMSGVNKKQRRDKGHIDAISANIILQSYLEMKRP